MMIRLFKRMAITAMVLALPAAAEATTYQVSGIFSDGTTLTGSLDVNVYGYLAAADLTTQADGVFTSFTYSGATSSFSGGPTFIDLQPGYTSDLHLAFDSGVAVPRSKTLLGTSYECQGSYNCYVPSNGNIRYLVSGAATIPEPASWMLMIGGFALAGGALRRSRAALA